MGWVERTIGVDVRRASGASVAVDAPLLSFDEDSETLACIRARDAVYRRLLAVADSLSMLLALWIAGSIVAGGSLEPAALAVLPLTVLLAKAMGLYDRDATRLHKDTLDELPTLLSLATVGALLVFLTQGVLASAALDELAIAVLWVALYSFLIFGRAMARLVAGRTTPPERCLLVGPESAASEFASKLYAQGARAELVGVIEPEIGNGGADLDGHSLASRLAPILEQREVHRVVFASGPWEADELLHTIGDLGASGVKVSVLPPISRIAALSFDLDQLPGMALLGMRRFEITRSSMLLKRCFDIAVSSCALAAISPLLLATAVAIKLDSRGSVLFRQTRVGRRGQHFQMLKFRSMVDGADERKKLMEHPANGTGLFKLEHDPRVTRLGRIIRRLSIDELPQLINVLRGEMSMVGPRPLIPHEDAMVEGRFRRRLNVRPGITGHWQILGSLRVPLDEMVTLDYLYVANWSLWTDIKLIARTIPYLVFRGNV